MFSNALFKPHTSELSLSDLEYKPCEQHVEHYIFYRPSHAAMTPRSKIKPYLDQGFSLEMEGSSFLHMLARTQIMMPLRAGYDWIFKFTAARLAVLRLYEYFIDEKIKAMMNLQKTTGKSNPEREMLQKLKNKVLLENDLTTLLCARYACHQYGKTIINTTGRPEFLKMYGVEKGFLAPAFSVNYVDDCILQVNDLSVSKIIYYNPTSPYDEKGTNRQDPDTRNLFAEWLEKKPRHFDLELKMGHSINDAMSATLPLATYFNDNAHNFDCSALMMYWLRQLNHPGLIIIQQKATQEVLENWIVKIGNEVKDKRYHYLGKYLELMQRSKATLEDQQARIREFEELANQIFNEEVGSGNSSCDESCEHKEDKPKLKI